MLIKPHFISGLLLPFLLITEINAALAVEGKKLEVVAETSNEHPIVETKTKTETSRLQNNKNVNNKTSIKMIVGGQSKDGVAKSINLPVNAK